jgi:putative membrane protein
MRGFLDGDAPRALEDAIRGIEASSAAEVVVAIRRQSALWLHAHVIVGAAAAIAALGYMLFGAHAFALTSILIDPFVVGAVIGAAVELWPAGKRLLTPQRIRRGAVDRAARATFVERGVHHTRGRTGILIYLSLAERDAAVVADAMVAATWPSEAQARCRAALIDAIARGGPAVAAVIAGLAGELGTALPRAHDDVNELSDAVDVKTRPRRGPR